MSFHGRLVVTSDTGHYDYIRRAAHDITLRLTRVYYTSLHLNARDKEGRTALHLAILGDSYEAMEALIESGCNLQLKDNDNNTPLHLAVIHNKVKAAGKLVMHLDESGILHGDGQGRTALHLAAELDHEMCAQILLDTYTRPPTQRCNNGYLPIHVAARNSSVGVVRHLIKWAEERACEREMTTLPDLDGNAPLHQAVQGRAIKVVEQFLKVGALISTQQLDLSTPVHLACSQGALDVVKLMFSLQPQEAARVLMATDAQGMTPLHCAAMFNHFELVAFILEQGAAIDATDRKGRSPLLLAAAHGGWLTIDVLLSHGADLTLRDMNGRNLVHVVIMNGESVCKLLALIKSKLLSLLNERDAKGWSPLHYASKGGQLCSLLFLLSLGACVRVRDQLNENPLHFAAKLGRYNTVKKLLESEDGFFILNQWNNEGKTALHLASQAGHTRVVQLLLSRGALLHRDHQGRTPLHLAAEGGHTRTITAILAIHGHTLNQRDKDGNTALHLAVRSNMAEVVSHLLSLDCLLVENNMSYKPIDCAITFKIHEAALAMVTHPRGPIEVLQQPSKIHGLVCLAIIRNLPKVFEVILTQAIVKSDIKENSKEFYEMVKCGRVELLLHPLTQKFLEMKWEAYGRFIHLFNLALYVVFLCLVTYFGVGILAILDPEVAGDNITHDNSADVDGDWNATEGPLDDPKDSSASGGSRTDLKTDDASSEVSRRSPIVTWMFSRMEGLGNCNITMSTYITSMCIMVYAVYGMLRELVQLYHQNFRYLASPINVVEWTLYATAIRMVLPVYLEGRWDSSQVIYAALALLTAWFTLLLYFQRFNNIGLYVAMFLEILNTLLKVFFVFSVLIVAFSLAFFILMSHEEGYAAANPVALLAVFMILMPILLVNLLIGLAVGDIEAVKKNAQLKRIAMQVYLHTELENMLPKCLISRVNKSEVVVYPNAKSSESRGLLACVRYAFGFLGSFRKERLLLYFAAFDTPDSENQINVCKDMFERQQRQLRRISTHLEHQSNLMRLIMQKMEIRSDIDDYDEGVTLEKPECPTYERPRFSASALNHFDLWNL
ncbi:transient receptor potential cation channel subfamily A member 1-like [Penaeus japonicus]|uniref:transient receptor potential cation channel subfamily A member 1-like n=1 Tax=Penaeus japonicus TaxID=27405 RepID=UPI001C714700|nr:transient receptor potential cation channel subfamily A member 1-like [Penaeus japonicus]